MNDCHILSRQRKRSASKSSLPGCVPSTLLPLSISEHSVPEHKLATATSNIFTHSSKKPSYYRYTQLDELWAQTDRVCNDEPDVSHHPSYTITKFSYNLNCHLRYKDATKRYNNQLKREIANFVASRRSICDQHFARSIFSYTSLWPPLHTKQEIEYFNRAFFQLTPKQKKRLNYLMKTNLSDV